MDSHTLKYRANGVLVSTLPTSKLRGRKPELQLEPTWTQMGRSLQKFSKMASSTCSDVEKLLRKIEQSQIGYDSTLEGPFGTRKGAFPGL